MYNSRDNPSKQEREGVREPKNENYSTVREIQGDTKQGRVHAIERERERERERRKTKLADAAADTWARLRWALAATWEKLKPWQKLPENRRSISEEPERDRCN